MRKLALFVVVSTALGGCLTPSAYGQSKGLIGQTLSQAVDRYGPPDQPVTGGAHAYSWSRGRFAGACKLSVKVDPAERITRASVVAVGLRTCKSVLGEDRPR